MSEDVKPLQAVSNVIELKPGCKYLLLFQGDHVSQAQVAKLRNMLADMGISCLSVTIDTTSDLQVVEVPE